MSDENYFDDEDDELPEISIGNSEVGSSFSISSAEEIARQRALEAAKEKQIEEKRKNIDAECNNDVKVLARTDSSGSSECELSLRNNLETLRLGKFEVVADDDLTVLIMIEKMMTIIPEGNNKFFTNYVDCLKNKSKEDVEYVNDNIIDSIAEHCASNSWCESELLGITSWCSVMVTADIGGLRVRRVLRYLLDNVFSYEQIVNLYNIIKQCIRGGNRLLKLCSAYRTGSELHADTLSNAVLRLALINSMNTGLKTDFATDISVKWLLSVITPDGYNKLNSKSRYWIVLLVGRALSYQNFINKETNCQELKEEQNDRERLMKILTKKISQPNMKKQLGNFNEQLKVEVAALKLKILFSFKNDKEKKAITKQEIHESREIEQPKDESREIKQPKDESREKEQPKDESPEIKQPKDESREKEQPKDESREIEQPKDESREIKQPKDESREIEQPKDATPEINKQIYNGHIDITDSD